MLNLSIYGNSLVSECNVVKLRTVLFCIVFNGSNPGWSVTIHLCTCGSTAF